MRTVKLRLLYSVALAVMAGSMSVLNAGQSVVAMVPAGVKWG
jgi:hypothetical protein